MNEFWHIILYLYCIEFKLVSEELTNKYSEETNIDCSICIMYIVFNVRQYRCFSWDLNGVRSFLLCRRMFFKTVRKSNIPIPATHLAFIYLTYHPVQFRTDTSIFFRLNFVLFFYFLHYLGSLTRQNIIGRIFHYFAE